MEWYEIVIAIPVIVIGAFLGIKLKEQRKVSFIITAGGIVRN